MVKVIGERIYKNIGLISGKNFLLLSILLDFEIIMALKFLYFKKLLHYKTEKYKRALGINVS